MDVKLGSGCPANAPGAIRPPVAALIGASIWLLRVVRRFSFVLSGCVL